MPSLRTAATTARGLSSRLTTNPTLSSHNPIKTFSAATHSNLYLDFLAPSWRPALTQPSRSHPLSTSRHHLRHTSTSTSTSSTSSSKPPPPTNNPSSTAHPILNPRTDSSGAPYTINITRRAAQRLAAIAAKDNTPDLALRVTVESGGCHGFQYMMSLTRVAEIEGDETVFEEGGDGVYKAKVVMDEPTLEMLHGSSVDYTMELIGSQFVVTGIPGATSSCGCGTSFDVAF